MVDRGNCTFTNKANISQAANASAILIINTEKELYKMVCKPDETDVNIHIPAVILPRDAGRRLENMLMSTSSFSVQLYSPRRPIVNIAEVFLWLMAVGTILCASYWSAWSARKAAVEQDKLLKDSADEIPGTKDSGASGVIYGLRTGLVAFLSRWFKRAREPYIEVPLFGAISYLTLAVSPFCITFSVLWAVYRNISAAWMGQDGIAMIITVLQIVHIPNLKVGAVLLSCAFMYDLFWVFVSKKLFSESVMIAVARGGFGDILLPGLLVAFALRYDWLAYKTLRAGYFLWAMFAYGFGLLITYVALNLMDGHGQPALLYIVPFTLGTFLTLGRKRGDLRTLWSRGEPQSICPHIRLQHSEDLNFE
ncbi:hypothetical protein L6164_019456 [Bauhinia variegata]|uniref:Uncharacterized protein n=1 Tax=Bauhinia variegata TaxID=167791 RepID=A0ACB9MWN4_BAUVA|nr:hypothetical protein L6164_019456 [Bauhinia variegata]